ncbi:MAG: hypothetical protein ACYDBB_07080 [Armatimonadota bacterium]
MKQLHLLCLTSMLAMTLLSPAALAVPAPAIPSGQGASAAASQDQTTVTSNNEPVLSWFDLGVAFGHLGVSGNEKRFEQYITPPEGVYLSNLDFYNLPATGTSLFDLSIRDLGESSGGGNLFLSIDNNALLLRAAHRRSRFFRVWDIADEAFHRRDTAADLALASSQGEIFAFFNHLDFSGQPSNNPEDWTRRIAGGSFTTNRTKWRTRVGYDNQTVTFREGDFFNTNTDTFRLAVTPVYSDRATLEASAAYSRTSLDGVDNTPSRLGAALEGSRILSPTLSIDGLLSINQVSDVIAENAYASENNRLQLNADYRGIARTNIRVGAGMRQVDYVDGMHAGTVEATENNVYAKAATRLSKKLKLKASAAHWWTNDRPRAYDLVTNLPIGSLVWSNKDDQRAELSFSPNWRTGISAEVRRRAWENQDFATDNSIVTKSLFGWWMPSDSLTLFTSLQRQNFNLRGFSDAGLYLTDADVAVIGASYQINPRLVLDASLTDGEYTGGEQSDQRGYAFGLTYSWPTGDALSFHSSFDRFNSAVSPDLNYTGRWYEVRFTKAIF